MSRDDFSDAVKQALAKRSAYICSNPDCRTLTIAPAESSAGGVLYIGKAAHITAAAPGGSRYDAHISSAERSAIENAIFLCSSCADLIDKNKGADFPRELLCQWKVEHEAWVRSNLNKRPEPPIPVVDGVHEAHGAGEVTALDIQGPAILQAGTVSRASGVGSITATRIGSVNKE